MKLLLPRKKYEGKGKKDLSLPERVKKKVTAGISYQKGVIMCEDWDPKIHFNGNNYKEFVKLHWPAAQENSINPKSKLVLQDDDPVQKSKQAHLEYKVYKICNADNKIHEKLDLLGQKRNSH